MSITVHPVRLAQCVAHSCLCRLVDPSEQLVVHKDNLVPCQRLLWPQLNEVYCQVARHNVFFERILCAAGVHVHDTISGEVWCSGRVRKCFSHARFKDLVHISDLCMSTAVNEDLMAFFPLVMRCSAIVRVTSGNSRFGKQK